jgi:micrococcal nuclease
MYASVLQLKRPRRQASMKRLTRRLVFAFILVAVSPCFPWSWKCVGISDGDTIRVLHLGTAERIRLLGIECPERGQDFGTHARKFTSDIVFGKVVDVEPVDRDRYGRTVAWVNVDGKSLNKELPRAQLKLRAVPERGSTELLVHGYALGDSD